MNFIKNQQLGITRPFRSHYFLPVVPVIPVEIAVTFKVPGYNIRGQGCFADLPGAADKNHLVRQILDNNLVQIAIFYHNLLYIRGQTGVKKFCV